MLSRLALQSAAIAISARVVGAGFRVIETYNPQLKKNVDITNPKLILKREAMTLSFAWIFTALAGEFLQRRGNVFGLSLSKVNMIIAFAGAFLAEGLSRVFAYRKSFNAAGVASKLGADKLSAVTKSAGQIADKVLGGFGAHAHPFANVFPPPPHAPSPN